MKKMIEKQFTYYCTSDLVFEVCNTFTEKVSNELSMNAQFDFNKISFELITNEELEKINFEGQDDKFYIPDLSLLQTILKEILEEFSLNCLDLFSIHESEDYRENMICFSTNQLSKEEELLLQVLNASEFEEEQIEYSENEEKWEKMPRSYDWADFHSEIESELEKKHLVAEFDHIGYESDYLDFYYLIYSE
jgi:hypothetical protein